jgi:hypothetical protein
MTKLLNDQATKQLELELIHVPHGSVDHGHLCPMRQWGYQHHRAFASSGPPKRLKGSKENGGEGGDETDWCMSGYGVEISFHTR